MGGHQSKDKSVQKKATTYLLIQRQEENWEKLASLLYTRQAQVVRIFAVNTMADHVNISMSDVEQRCSGLNA